MHDLSMLFTSFLRTPGPLIESKRLSLTQSLLLANRCSSKGLEDSLCVRIIVTRDGDIRKTLDPVAAVNNRDALAKTIYSRLFDW